MAPQRVKKHLFLFVKHRILLISYRLNILPPTRAYEGSLWRHTYRHAHPYACHIPSPSKCSLTDREQRTPGLLAKEYELRVFKNMKNNSCHLTREITLKMEYRVSV